MLKIKIISDFKSLEALRRFEADFKEITKELSDTLIGLIKSRIHQEGQKADSSQIGTYEASYLPTRKRYNRGAGTKVILSLTGGLENSYFIVQDENGNYAVAIINDKYTEIAVYLEEKYGEIFSATKEELAIVNKVISARLSKELAV